MGRYEEYDPAERTAAQQASAIEASPTAQEQTRLSTDAPQASSEAKATDAPQATSQQRWQDQLPPGVDPGWVVRVRQKLVESGKHGWEIIDPENLKDPEHLKWLNKQMRSVSETAETPAAQTGGAEPAPAQTGGAEPAPAAAPKPKVMPTGRIPKGEIYASTPLAGAGGAIPAGEGSWWPPYPTTTGKVEGSVLKPATQTMTSAAQAAALSGGYRTDANGGY